MSLTAINLAKLPAPSVVEALDFEAIFAAMRDDFLVRDPAFSALVESDPAYKILEVCAYRELLLRQRINESARGVMLAYAAGADLEHLAALFNLERQVVDPGDASAIPPIAPTYETDARLRERVQLATEAVTVAGSIGAYEFHALSASPLVKDVDVASPAPGDVYITVLSSEGDGVPSSGVLGAVGARLTADAVRPLTDHVFVQAATVTGYTVNATLTLYSGPDDEVVRQAALAALTAYTAEHHRLGHDITRSGLFAALHQPGVQNVTISAPAADLVCGPAAAYYCTGITLIVVGRDE